MHADALITWPFLSDDVTYMNENVSILQSDSTEILYLVSLVVVLVS